jgi:peptide-N4-(N-acetyl-beta-glucosaminyl)asparagine amidase
MSINLDLTTRLENNPKEKYLNGVAICIKLLDNIVSNPKEEKFRKFKKSNARISNELLILDGMEELILDIGFELDNGEFVLRKGGLGAISKLKNHRDFLNKRLDIVKSNQINPTGAIQKVISPSKPTIPSQIKIVADKPFHQRTEFPQVLKTTNSFILLIENLSDTVMQYEDESLKKSALQIIPVEKLKLNAIENLRKYQALIKKKEITEEEPPLDDFILEELAAWFKNDFFTWVNNMDCKKCKGETRASGGYVSNGVRVEEFTCDKCHVITNFPRYNDIEKLLVTRRGRCGEFANCFTFLCLAMGYDARYIYSTSDHVWTEVYNHSKKRFIHIDPSENVFDSPLMYEHGWKRNLEYVIAFARDDVQDVTWRYSNQHQELAQRRKKCNENDLNDAIIALRIKRQSSLSEARKKFCTLRTLSELAELMIIREPTENEKKGRSSGSLSWRLGRGEMNESKNYVFQLSSKEVESKQFILRYSCSKNCYERLNGNSIIDSANDWKTWEFKSENIFRKLEHDHKMAYLARNEDSDFGKIQWKFDFGKHTIKSISLDLESKTFESGKIDVRYLNETETSLSSKDDLIGASKFSIEVHLSQGNGDCAWQHAQLFRQKLNSENFPFRLKIEFN